MRHICLQTVCLCAEAEKVVLAWVVLVTSVRLLQSADCWSARVTSTELTNYTLYNTMTIALAVHYCTLDLQTTFKFPVVLGWAVTGSAG